MDAPFSPDVLDELTKYDSPTICNIIELFDCRARNVGYASQEHRDALQRLGPTVIHRRSFGLDQRRLF